MFEVENREQFNYSLAILLHGIINADGRADEKEKRKFIDLMINLFHVDKAEAEDLFVNAKGDDFAYHANVIRTALDARPFECMQVMNALNQVIISDHVETREYQIFDEVKQILIDSE